MLPRFFSVRGLSGLAASGQLAAASRRRCPALGRRIAESRLYSAATPSATPIAELSLKEIIVKGLSTGLVSGGAGTLVGVGGALFMVPLSQRIFGLRQLHANATALLPNVATCISGVVTFAAADQVDWTTAALVAVSAVVTTRFGAKAAHKLTERTQKMLFGVGMCTLGPVIALKPWLQEHFQQQRGGASQQQAEEKAAVPYDRTRVPTAREAAYLLTLGAATGVCSGMLGIGAGSMVVVGLAPLHALTAAFVTPCLGAAAPLVGPQAGGPADMSHKMLLGTSFAAQALPHMTAAATHYQLGNLQLRILPALFAGSLVGSAISSNLAVHVPDKELRALFGLYAVSLGASYIRAATAIKAAVGGAQASAGGAAATAAAQVGKKL